MDAVWAEAHLAEEINGTLANPTKCFFTHLLDVGNIPLRWLHTVVFYFIKLHSMVRFRLFIRVIFFISKATACKSWWKII